MSARPTRRPTARKTRRLLAGLTTAAVALVAPAVLAPAAHADTAADLFISEYVEGSSNNKALEIFNGTGGSIDLAAGGYVVQVFANGATTANATINLSGTIAAGDVHVLANPSAGATVLALADQTSGSLTFNGDDAVVVKKGAAVLDAFGQIGNDPGTEWGSGLTSTADNTLRRKSSICAGRTDGTSAFDPASEWDGFVSDTFDGLGAHTATCTPPAESAPTITALTPADGASSVPVNTAVSVTFSEPVTVTTGGITLVCDGAPVAATLGGSGTAYTLTPEANLATGASCTATVSASAVSDTDTNDPPDNLAADVTSSFTVVTSDPCTLPYTPIPQIQGSGAATTMTGSHTTQGVVVGDYEGASPNLRGFYLQDPAGDGDPATSDGLFVFNGSNLDSVSLGDVVRVTGTVGENQGQTQISASSTSIVRCGTGTVEPAEVTLPFASDATPEAFEGMLVSFPQQLSVTEHFQLGRFGQVVLSSGGRLDVPTNVVAPGPDAVALQAANNRNRIIVDDATQAQNPDPIVFGRGGAPLSASNTLRGGDTATGATGVLSYTWGGNAASPNAYRLRPLQSLGGGIDFVAANQRPSGPPSVGGSVQVAGMNLLNYFNTFGNACTGGVNGPGMECRGAENQLEFDRQNAKTVAAILALDADVVGVNEIENDGYGPTSALADLVGRLNAASAPGTWAYVDADAGTGTVDALGSDAIKVGMLYKPGVVTPTGTTAALNTAAFVNGGDTSPRNRASLAQAWQVNATGAVFLANINHLKSKGSECETPDLQDGQGNCSIVRTNAARALTAWLATDPTGTGDPDVVLLGDYNSYAKEKPIQAIEEAGFTNLIASLLGADAYSYVFDGQWGYLDHAFASTSMADQVTGVGEYHINADEPSVLDYNTNFKTAAQIISLYAADEFRVSDHDPVLVGLEPNAAPTVTAGGPYAVDEGGSLQLAADGSDPNAGEELAYAWDLDGDGTFETTGRTTTFDASGLDGPDTRTVTVKVTDGGSLSATATATVTVRNVAPSVQASFTRALFGCGPNNAGLTVSFTDPAAADTHKVVVSWGDGTSSTIDPATSALNLSHRYTRAGAYDASVVVTDDDGGAATATATAKVAYKTQGLRAPLKSGSTVTVKAGSTLPVKIGYTQCNGTPASTIDPVATVKLGGTVVATGSLSYRAGIWQWNLATGSLPNKTGTYVVSVTVPETGQVNTATFTLRR